MVTLDDVAAFALALPDVTESERRGTRTWSTGEKVFAWERQFSKADIKRYGAEDPPAGPILAVRVMNLDEKDAVLSLDRPGFFTIPHFDGYPAVLIQLDAVEPEAVREASRMHGARASPEPAQTGAESPMASLASAELVDWVDRAAWRAWLEANHASATGVWLVMHRREARSGLYEMAVEEALCFGWIDSTAGRVDEERGKLYFAPRKSSSGWAATNKARIERLLAEGRMAPAGLAAIERAKANGSWSLLDSVERLEVPEDLAAALAARRPRGRQLRGLAAIRPEAGAHLARVCQAAGDATRAGRAHRRRRREERAPGLTGAQS